MRSAELITFGIEGVLSNRLGAWSQDRGLWHRPLQHASAVANLLRKGSRGFFLLKVGRDLVGELELVREAAQEFPEVAVIVLGEQDHPQLQGLAFDLGAAAVVFPPTGIEELFETLDRMQTQRNTSSRGGDRGSLPVDQEPGR